MVGRRYGTGSVLPTWPVDWGEPPTAPSLYDGLPAEARARCFAVSERAAPRLADTATWRALTSRLGPVPRDLVGARTGRLGILGGRIGARAE